MNGDQPKETEATSHDVCRMTLVILAAVLIPNVLHDAVGLSQSWGNVFGVALASTLGYFFLPAPKKNIGRFVLITLGLCVFGYLIGRFVDRQHR